MILCENDIVLPKTSNKINCERDLCVKSQTQNKYIQKIVKRCISLTQKFKLPLQMGFVQISR